MITPQEFAGYLQNCSLDPKTKVLLLDILPKLSQEQIQEIGRILEKDQNQLLQYLKEAELKADVLTEQVTKEIEDSK
ncbi:hypothetical protein HZA38_00585 [Candidatus Peregrinibacteria bacterium]|nr:hypothetical protein [Candidatus Peregrinibacteria bacterium]